MKKVRMTPNRRLVGEITFPPACDGVTVTGFIWDGEFVPLEKPLKIATDTTFSCDGLTLTLD